MAHLLRGKQAGVQNDLSAGLTPDLFALDDVLRYGVNSQISCLAYDPVQSILAVGTKTTKFGPSQIYLFGQHRVQVVLQLPPRGASVKTIQFCAEKLVCLDDKSGISVFSLELRKLLVSHAVAGAVSVLCTDPMLDYALLGMQTGEVVAYDLDRETLAPFKIPNLWATFDSRERVTSIVSVQFHPRDIGTLLIGYVHGACIYSFKLAKALRFYRYELQPGAPGGESDRIQARIARRPRLTQAVWHPTGTFVLTGHEDGSIVTWDALKDGRMLMARTLTDTNIATPGAIGGGMGQNAGTSAVKEPLYRISWCANQDPEDTAILISGGQSTQSPTKGLTLFEMGRTPVYATSSWDVLTNYFDSPKRQRILPTPPGAEVVDFCLVPRMSPHFAGAHDPLAVLALLASGELLTLSFPSGMPISPTNQLHLSLTFVHPFIKRLTVVQMDRERWLGLTERRQQGPLFLRGGSELPKAPHRSDRRNIAQSIHADGSIRVWDPGYGDEVENGRLLQADVGRAVGTYEGVDVTHMSLAPASCELAVGTRGGELVIFRWSTNRNAGKEPPPSRQNQPGLLTSITDRADPALSEGLMPFTLLNQQNGPVTAVRMSEVGFAAAAFEGGSIAVLDMRGPAIIFTATVSDFSKSQSKGSIRRRASNATDNKPEWGTQMEFSVMTMDGDDYSSIMLHVGTNLGHLATFKVLPDPSGRYIVQYAGSVTLDSKVMHIAPLNADSGKPALATQHAVGNLASGYKVNGVLLAVTPTSIHLFRPATTKGAHKSFENVFCDVAGVVRYRDQGHALLGLFGDGCARAYAIPSLKEIASIRLNNILDVRRFSDAVITPTGDILGFTGPSELAFVSVFGTGQLLVPRSDKVCNPQALIPPRPTISTVAWVTGTQYITPADMDVLIGGPDRPPSKRMVAQARSEEQQRLRAQQSSTSQTASALSQSDEGYWAYMQRQIQERTEKLGMMGDSMDNLEQNSANWLDDVNKYVNKQKRGVVTGLIKSKFGL